MVRFSHFKSIKFLVFILAFLPSFIHGQELNLSVKVMVQTSFTVDPALFKDLEKDIRNFMNTTKWTDEEYQPHEKISGTMQITITSEPSPNVFQAELILQTSRPVYNSNYESPVLNIIDKNVMFNFTGIQPLLKTTNTFYDNISAILSYYAYVIIGFDDDSFSLYGGNLQFSRAQEIINSLPGNMVRDEGWRNDLGSRRNRFWLIENLLDGRMRQFRQAFYDYHRMALDNMYNDPDRSRAVMLSALTAIGQANVEYPNTMLVQVFGDTKKDEIIEIFKMGDKGQKTKVTNIMVGMDAAKKDRYSVLN
ncbi:MAG: DUF4835 family protein [Saprospiraceae bacterium]|nr:DUF4835 family protein [Saprospiraceae bacterium]